MLRGVNAISALSRIATRDTRDTRCSTDASSHHLTNRLTHTELAFYGPHPEEEDEACGRGEDEEDKLCNGRLRQDNLVISSVCASRSN